jgi:hypothetical protein
MVVVLTCENGGHFMVYIWSSFSGFSAFLCLYVGSLHLETSTPLESEGIVVCKTEWEHQFVSTY